MGAPLSFRDETALPLTGLSKHLSKIGESVPILMTGQLLRENCAK